MRKRKRELIASLDAIEALALGLRSDGWVIGYQGQIEQIAGMEPLVAAYVAVQRYKSRLADDLAAELSIEDDNARYADERRSPSADNADGYVKALRIAAARQGGEHE